MIEKYDVVEITRDNISECGLSKGSEHYIAFVCEECEIAGIVVNGGTEQETVLYLPDRYLKVVGEADSNMTRRYIDGIKDKHHLWKCDHD